MAAYYNDSYVTARPPVFVIPVTAVKVINPNDKKYGPRSGGTAFVPPESFSE